MKAKVELTKIERPDQPPGDYHITFRLSRGIASGEVKVIIADGIPFNLIPASAHVALKQFFEHSLTEVNAIIDKMPKVTDENTR